MEKQRILIWAGIALAILVGCALLITICKIKPSHRISLCVVLSLKH